MTWEDRCCKLIKRGYLPRILLIKNTQQTTSFLILLKPKGVFDMFNSLKRPYKAVSAKDTISKIKNILNDIDFLPVETFNANPYPDIYSVRVEVSNDKGSFGTNGKGRTPEFSLASGYAEFVERVQNHLYANFSRTIVNHLKSEYGFYYYPDESYISKAEFYDLPEEIQSDLLNHKIRCKDEFLKAYFDRLEFNKVPGMVSIPFYDTKNNDILYLPINLLYLSLGSNGMAAGNTRAEAIFQGLCELMERWGAAEIFYNQMTPPTVPDDYLRFFEEEYKVIKTIEESGKYKVVIKDFSAGKNIPAVGIIITNKETGKYRLNVGSDTSFQVALSRCITEIYQGITDDEKFDESSLNIPVETPDYFSNYDEKSLYKRYEVYSEFTKDGSGSFPPSLFGQKADYAFNPDIFTVEESYEKEVQKTIFNFHKLGYNVYIRDVSYLGFPSVMVYIPKVSALGIKNAPAYSEEIKFNSIETDKIESMFYRFETLTSEELQKIEAALSAFELKEKISEVFYLDFIRDCDWSEMNLAFFMSLLRYRLGKFKEAFEAFEVFIKDRKNDVAYYSAAFEYMKYKADGKSHDEIVDFLYKKNFDRKVVDMVCSDLKDPKDIFQYVKFPVCPDCNNCHLDEFCITKGKILVTDKLYQTMKKNMPDQRSLSELNQLVYS